MLKMQERASAQPCLFRHLVTLWVASWVKHRHEELSWFLAATKNPV